MEEQELTTELAAVQIKKEDAIGKRREWRGGWEVREGVVRRRGRRGI